MRSRISALLTLRAVPGWLLFLWEASERLERIEYINEKRRLRWEIGMTPTGQLVVLLISVLWLTVVVLWPEISKWWRNASGELLNGARGAIRRGARLIGWWLLAELCAPAW